MKLLVLPNNINTNITANQKANVQTKSGHRTSGIPADKHGSKELQGETSCKSGSHSIPGTKASKNKILKISLRTFRSKKQSG